MFKRSLNENESNYIPWPTRSPERVYVSKWSLILWPISKLILHIGPATQKINAITKWWWATSVNHKLWVYGLANSKKALFFARSTLCLLLYSSTPQELWRILLNLILFMINDRLAPIWPGPIEKKSQFSGPFNIIKYITTRMPSSRSQEKTNESHTKHNNDNIKSKFNLFFIHPYRLRIIYFCLI